jgi:glutamate formiminotransferase/formiminotetrahydrofolate cyclodeaminase
MNLTNFRQTSISTVVEEIRKEAKGHGTDIHSSELVGLIPQEALFDAAQSYLQMDRFVYEQVLETRLYAAEQQKTSAPSFLDQLAAGTATPGGGSAAAYAGAMGASLVAMVAKLSTGKEKFRQIEPRMDEIFREAETLRQSLANAVEEDANAFKSVMQAYRMSKDTEEERANRLGAIEDAIQEAVDVPVGVAKMGIRIMELAREVAHAGNLNAISDAGTAGAMASAAVKSASMNVRINALSTPNASKAEIWVNEIEALEQIAEATSKAITSVLKERGGI